MSLLLEKYKSLAPQATYLADPVVLSQAWKKTHSYIRRHNWYADVLELDCSTTDIEQQLTHWAIAVQEAGFRPEAMRIVPAPKNAAWHFPRLEPVNPFLPKPPSPPSPGQAVGLPLPPPFPQQAPAVGLPGTGFSFESLLALPAHDEFSAWRPVADNEQSASNQSAQKMRPLAHLNIRDQTLATAVMLCVADAVESAQGDTSEADYIEARRRGVCSYGNRLHCAWVKDDEKNERAMFGWGNSRLYSQYFQDYRRFLARPRAVCQHISNRLPAGKELFVISLDIKSFFDGIDRAALIEQLKLIYATYAERLRLQSQPLDNDAFWTLVSRIFDWSWHPDDAALASKMNGEQSLPDGLPQGLVSSGFFANAYMLKFDATLSAAIGSEIGSAKFVLHDYSRYVDDMRLVVEATQNEISEIGRAVSEHVGTMLAQYCDAIGAKQQLSLNVDKTVVTPYRSLSTQSNLSALMELFQEVLSGTPDMDSLRQAAGGLDGLLWTAEQLQTDAATSMSKLALAHIAAPNTDVRDDTVKRFVATRITKAMRMRLAMTDVNGPVNDELAYSSDGRAGRNISHEFEAVARKLIKCWSENPSLVLLLRCGLDLFPHPKLLDPVIEALTAKLFAKSGPDAVDSWRQIATAHYVVADLFRAGAIETGFRPSSNYPERTDINGYRQLLARFARRILREKVERPWYLKQQAALLLASLDDHSANLGDADELSLYRQLHDVMLYKPVESGQLLRVLPLSLVGQQLAPNPERYASWFIECMQAPLNPFHPFERGYAARTLSRNRPDLMLTAYRSSRGKDENWRSFVPSSLRHAARTKTRGVRRVDGESIALTALIEGPKSEFRQENAVLALLVALLENDSVKGHLETGLQVQEISVICSNWSKLLSIPEQDNYLQVSISRLEGESDEMFATPPWVNPEQGWLYGLGRILRSCITGEFDFTVNAFLLSEEASRYSGLRSTWFKRRFGLLNTSAGLLDEPGPISPWLSDLLISLLQWPGIGITSANELKGKDFSSRASLLAFVKARAREQRNLYGKLSETPVYVVPVSNDAPTEHRNMRVAIVQTMLPAQDDFNVKDPLSWSPSTLARHHSHLAEVCNLAHQKLRAWATAQGRPSKPGRGDEAFVDLIVFPELSIHPEHLDVLRGLSDSTHASIFAGLTFIQPAGHKYPINQALWMIRTETPTGGRTIQYAWQGKKHPMRLEQKMGIKGHRPYQLLVEFPIGKDSPTRVAGTICYDATDLSLVADLREVSDMFVVAALNQDVQTFDNMVAALNFHMYQPVILANSGEFGGSTAQAPLPKHEKLISHVHGNHQIAVSVFEIDASLFKSVERMSATKEVKTPPAAFKGRPKNSA
ncbi:RNA-directed DNA polymerase [Paraburkholderia aspalathi]|uniref:RNA-directed DNA polymerase n=1 Tax=Paraburkholderia aspalathi TaxID=1324617 RepID=UPI0038B8D398